MRRESRTIVCATILSVVVVLPAPAAAGVIDVTDPDSPVERFFRVSAAFAFHETVYQPGDMVLQGAEVVVNATEPGLPHGTATGRSTGIFDGELEHRATIVLGRISSATLTSSGGGDTAYILLQFADVAIRFRLYPDGPVRMSTGMGWAWVVFETSTGRILQIGVEGQTPEFNTFAAIGTPQEGARVIEY